MDDLTDRLTRLAERTAPPPREDLARTVVRRHRQRRRQAVGLTAVAAAVAAVVVSVPVALSGPAAEPATAPATGEAAPATPAVPSADVLTLPTRGSLAGDAAFVEGVRDLPFGEGVPGEPDAAPGTRRVVFAGEVAGRRWALVAGEDVTSPGSLVAAWFTGPAGASAGEMTWASTSGGVAGGTPLAVSDASTGGLVVVAAPGDVVEVSRRPEVAADGSVSRVFAPVDAPGGVAVLALRPATGSHDEALRYRVVRDGATVLTAMPVPWRPLDSVSVGARVPWLADRAPDPVLTSTVDHVLVVTGLAPEEVSLDVAYSGSLPGEGAPGALQVVTATLPSGAVYLEVTVTRQAGTGATSSGRCAADLLPAGTPVTGRGFVLRCDRLDGAADPASDVTLVGPPGAVTARVDGTEVPLRDRVAVADGPVDVATVVFLAADGTVLAPAEELGHDGLAALARTEGWD